MGSTPPSAQRRRLGARAAKDRVRLDANPRHAGPGEKDVSSDVAEASREHALTSLRLARSAAIAAESLDAFDQPERDYVIVSNCLSAWRERVNDQDRVLLNPCHDPILDVDLLSARQMQTERPKWLALKFLPDILARHISKYNANDGVFLRIGYPPSNVRASSHRH